MIALAPSNNIKNIENMESGEQYKMAEHTANETLAIVEKALEKTKSLKKAVIMELPPRADSARLQSLTEYSNNVLKSAALNSAYKDQIVIGSLDSLYNYSNADIFGHPSSPSYDGIHMRGKSGKWAFTECITAAVKAAALTYESPRSSSPPTATLISTSNSFQALSN